MNKLILYFLLAAFFGALLFWVLSQKPAGKTVATPVATLTAEQLYRQFYEEENLSNEKYLNKTVRITGSLMDVTTDNAGFKTVLLGRGKPLARARLRKAQSEITSNLNVGDELTLICTCMGLVDAVELRDCRAE